ncbi:MAG TPA: CHASE3 domain-containing protein, partial [Steroidobacteraceae bacterium]
MKRSRSLVGIAVVVSSTVLIAAGYVAHRAIEQLSATGDAVLLAKAIELDYERLLSTLRDAETGQRGYLLTDEEVYLEPYQAAIRKVTERLATLTHDLSAAKESAEGLAPIEILVARKIEELARTVELNRAGQHEQA